MIIDIYSRKIVGWEVWNEENGDLASKLVERALISEKALVLHSDNGAPMKSFTLKSKKDAREWVDAFVDWYNNKHYHSGLNFLTSSSKHSGKDEEIMAHRRKVYNTARERHPQRFNKGIRNWASPSAVALNPTEDIKDKLKNTAYARYHITIFVLQHSINWNFRNTLF